MLSQVPLQALHCPPSSQMSHVGIGGGGPLGVGELGVGFAFQQSLWQNGKQEKPLLSAQQASQGPVFMVSQVPLHGAH